MSDILFWSHSSFRSIPNWYWNKIIQALLHDSVLLLVRESTTGLNLKSYVFFIYYLYIFCSCTFTLISWLFFFGKINKIILLIDKWKNRYLLPFPFLVSSSTLICLDGESSFLNSTLQTQVSVYLPMTCCHSYTSWSTYQFKFLLKLP